MSSVLARVWAIRPAAPTATHSTHAATPRVRAARTSRNMYMSLDSSAESLLRLCVLCTMRCTAGRAGYHRRTKLCDDSRREVADDNPERARGGLPDGESRLRDRGGAGPGRHTRP